MWVKGEIFRNLDEVTASARGELDRAAQTSLFDRLEWFQRTLAFAPPNGHPLIVRARADGSDCWLFLMQQGSKAVSLASWYALAFRPVFTGAPTQATKFALLVAIARRLAKRIGSIELSTMPADDATLLCRAFDRARWVTRSVPSTVNWTVSTDGLTFEDYLAQRPGELRSTIKRKAAKHEIQTNVVTAFDGRAWSDYETIYTASWKPEEGSPRFLRDMALCEGAAGTLRLGIARIGGQAVAAQLWTVENGHAMIHKLAHLESATAQSPGSVLTAAMFAHVIDQDGVSLVDFGTGDDRYKRDWMDNCAPFHKVQLFNPRRPSGLLGAAKASLSTLVGR